MTLDQRAAHIVRYVLLPSAGAISAEQTPFAQQKVLDLVTKTIATELRALLADYLIKFEP